MLLELNEEMQVFPSAEPLGVLRVKLERRMHVFPEPNSSCEARIYVFLRTWGFQNVTFNHKPREGSQC